MASQWFYQAMGKQVGPISSDELRSLAHAGVISRDTPVKNAPDGAWVPAERVRGLFPVSNATPPPLPVVASAPVDANPSDSVGEPLGFLTAPNPGRPDATSVTRRLSWRAVAAAFAGCLALTVLIGVLVVGSKLFSSPARETAKEVEEAEERPKAVAPGQSGNPVTGRIASVPEIAETGKPAPAKPKVPARPTISFHDAAERGRMDEIESHLYWKSDVNVRNERGWTPLHCAARTGETGAIKVLLANHADLNALAPLDFRPLDVAALNGEVAAARLLIDAGADVNAKNAGWPSIRGAMLKQRTSEMQQHLGKLTNAEVEELERKVRAIEGGTASPEEMERVHPLIPPDIPIEKKVRAVLEAKGRKVTRRVPTFDAIGETALHLAAAKGRVEVTRLLLMNHADANATAGFGTPLHFAAREGHPEVVTLLLMNGADVNAKNDFGNTALHEVFNTRTEVRAAGGSGRAHLAVIELLMEHGADTYAKNWCGDTPLAEKWKETVFFDDQLLRGLGWLEDPDLLYLLRRFARK